MHSDTYTPMEESNTTQSRQAIAVDLQRKIHANQCGFLDENYTSKQKDELLETLEKMKLGENLCTIIKTHNKKTGKKQNKIKTSMLKSLKDSINKGNPSLKIDRKLKDTPVVILHINGDTDIDDTGFNKGDWVVVFNTIEKPLKDTLQSQTDTISGTNGKELFTSKKDPNAEERDGIDVDGGQVLKLPKETYSNPRCFVDSLYEAVKLSLTSTNLIVSKSIGSNYEKGAGKYKGISFSGESYSWTGLQNMFIQIGKMHGVTIRCDRVTKGRPPKNSTDIRVRFIRWN